MKQSRRSTFILWSAFAIGGLTLFLPATALADACQEKDCTFYEDATHHYPGHCGPYDAVCGCFSDNPQHPGGQPQTACDQVST